MNVEKIIDLYFKPYFFLKAKYVQNKVRKSTKRYLNGKIQLTAEQKKKIRAFYAPYTKTTTVFHEFYLEKTGHFSEEFIPTDIYSNLIDNFYNNREEAKTMDNKCYYPMIFAGIPQAESVLFRKGGFWYDAEEKMIDLTQAVAVVKQEPAVFIKKATNSLGGKGVQYLNAQNCDIGNSFEKAIRPIQGDIVVQRPLKQHKALSAINESSVNTIRVLSLLQEDGTKIYSCILRMGVGDSKVDNASSGGITCGITEEGKLKKLAYKPSGAVFEKHPTSGLAFEGYEIPGFAEVRKMVEKAHPMVPHFRLVAWDFAINQEGQPVMIEANLCCGELDFHQLNNGPVFGEDTKKILDEVFRRK